MVYVEVMFTSFMVIWIAVFLSRRLSVTKWSGVIDAIGEGVEGYKVGDKVVVRPLDNRLEDASDKGWSHICKNLNLLVLIAKVRCSSIGTLWRSLYTNFRMIST